MEKVKQLVESAALYLFDPDLPTVVSTVASDYGFGAMLSQLQSNGTECTAAFAAEL